jgi:hypothetical protein
VAPLQAELKKVHEALQQKEALLRKGEAEATELKARLAEKPKERIVMKEVEVIREKVVEKEAPKPDTAEAEIQTEVEEAKEAPEPPSDVVPAGREDTDSNSLLIKQVNDLKDEMVRMRSQHEKEVAAANGVAAEAQAALERAKADVAEARAALGKEATEAAAAAKLAAEMASRQSACGSCLLALRDNWHAMPQGRCSG